MEELTLKTLLFTIVKNKALNRISHFEIRRKVHQEITEKFEKEFDNPDFYLENELFRLYENALKQLPKDYREAYEMNRNHRMTVLPQNGDHRNGIQNRKHQMQPAPFGHLFHMGAVDNFCRPDLLPSPIPVQHCVSTSRISLRQETT